MYVDYNNRYLSNDLEVQLRMIIVIFIAWLEEAFSFSI